MFPAKLSRKSKNLSAFPVQMKHILCSRTSNHNNLHPYEILGISIFFRMKFMFFDVLQERKKNLYEKVCNF